jgi:uncharacterized protein YybS (DUF2232 family)
MLLPLPILYYRCKSGRAPAATIGAVALGLMALAAGGLGVDLFFFAVLLLLGLALGETFEQHKPVETCVLFSCGTAVATGAAGLIIYSAGSDRHVAAVLTDYAHTNLQLTLELYGQLGVSEESMYQLSRSMDQVAYMLVRMLPALTVASAMFTAWLNLLISRPLFRFGGLVYPDFNPLNRWKAPEPLVWAAVGSGILLLLPITWVKLLGLNGLIVLMTVYFFQGIAVMAFFFEKKSFPPLLRFMLYSLVAIQQILLLAVIGCGFFDMWINFRKLNSG